MGDADAAEIRADRGDWMSEHLAMYLDSGGARGHIVDLSSVGGRQMTTARFHLTIQFHFKRRDAKAQRRNFHEQLS